MMVWFWFDGLPLIVGLVHTLLASEMSILVWFVSLSDFVARSKFILGD